MFCCSDHGYFERTSDRASPKLNRLCQEEFWFHSAVSTFEVHPLWPPSFPFWFGIVNHAEAFFTDNFTHEFSSRRIPRAKCHHVIDERDEFRRQVYRIRFRGMFIRGPHWRHSPYRRYMKPDYEFVILCVSKIGLWDSLKGDVSGKK